jgi:uncharacterized protein (TIGR03067 family)
MRSTSWFLTLALFAGAADPGTVDDKNDLNPLQGRYSMFLCFTSGEKLSPHLVKSGELVVEDNEYRPKLGASVASTTINVDSSKTPHSIDFTYTEGPQKGQTLKGIYKIEGNNLTICQGLIEQADRPTEFAAPVRTNRSLVVWKRAKTPASGKVKAIEQDRKQFEGNWRFVSIEVEGSPIPAKLFEEGLLTLKGKRFECAVVGNTTHGVFKIDPTPSPKTIDLTFSNGPGKDKTQKGIYELVGDTQKICFAKGDQARPTEFTSKPGSGRMIQVLKREKP